VITVYDVLEDEGHLWSVTEYVPGAVDLATLVSRRGPLSPPDVARIGLAALDALTVGHERGITHRDVKPANILLAPDHTGAPYERVMLTDYGISVSRAARETQNARIEAFVGSPGYLAPERATGGPPTPAADFFSLACTLYFAVEGVGPFARDSELAEVTAAVLEEPRPMVQAGALQPLLEAMLTKEPALRISAAEIEAELWRIVTSQPRKLTEPDEPSQPEIAGAQPGISRISPSKRRRIWIALGSAAGAAMLLAPSGVWWKPLLLGVVWVLFATVGLGHVRQHEPAVAAGHVDKRDLIPRRSPRRMRAFLDGLIHTVFFARPPTRLPRELSAQDDCLRDAFARLGPPGDRGEDERSRPGGAD
jgi:serine/threonine protein kinase